MHIYSSYAPNPYLMFSYLSIRRSGALGVGTADWSLSLSCRVHCGDGLEPGLPFAQGGAHAIPRPSPAAEQQQQQPTNFEWCLTYDLPDPKQCRLIKMIEEVTLQATNQLFLYEIVAAAVVIEVLFNFRLRFPCGGRSIYNDLQILGGQSDL